MKRFSFMNFNYNRVKKQSTAGQLLDRGQCCERHSKDDWEDDLGCERRSSILGREIIGRSWRREQSWFEEVIISAKKE
jgi:hypothetical protein